MVLTIQNVSLDDVFDRYDTADLSSLSNKQVQDIAKEKFVRVIMSGDNYQHFEKFETVQNIINKFTYSFTCPQELMSEEQREALRQAAGADGKKLTEPGTADVTYQLFRNLKLGVYNLLPGDEQQIDITQEAAEEWLMQMPAFKQRMIVIPELDGHIDSEEGTAEEHDAAREAAVKELTEKKMDEIRQLAKDYGFRVNIGMSKQEAANQLFNRGWRVDQK